MKEIGVYVWWSSGRGDGDGYEEMISVEDEEYEILKELNVNGKELDSIEDPRIKDMCQKKYKEIIEALYSESIEYEEDAYREECLIDPDDEDCDPDDEDYDPDGDEEHFTMTMREWWDEQYTVGVKFSHDFDENERSKRVKQ